MTTRTHPALTGLLLLTILLATAMSSFAQDTPSAASPLSPQQIAAAIKDTHPKVVVMVFDVTESTREGGVFGRERAATAQIIRSGCVPGDRVVLEAFGPGYKTVFDKVLTSNADAAALIDQIPERPEPGRGTNIRQPHHKALQLIDGSGKPGVVVLLTDSFNDRPLETDPDYPAYMQYYTLASLTKYPDTPENADYERLLRTLKAAGKLTQFGVGVGIAEDGRPIERLPVGPGESDSPESATAAPTELKPQGEEHPANSLPMVIGGIVAALLLLGAILYSLANRPLRVRLALGEKGSPRDYRLKPGAKVGLGGTVTTAASGDDAFPLAGAPQPVAFVKAGRGAATVVPAAEMPAGVALFHNGMKLERDTPLRLNDEIRIVLPTADGLSREHRVRYLDPKAPLI